MTNLFAQFDTAVAQKFASLVLNQLDSDFKVTLRVANLITNTQTDFTVWLYTDKTQDFNSLLLGNLAQDYVDYIHNPRRLAQLDDLSASLLLNDVLAISD